MVATFTFIHAVLCSPRTGEVLNGLGNDTETDRQTGSKVARDTVETLNWYSAEVLF